MHFCVVNSGVATTFYPTLRERLMLFVAGNEARALSSC